MATWLTFLLGAPHTLPLGTSVTLSLQTRMWGPPIAVACEQKPRTKPMSSSVALCFPQAVLPRPCLCSGRSVSAAQAIGTTLKSRLLLALLGSPQILTIALQVLWLSESSVLAGGEGSQSFLVLKSLWAGASSPLLSEGIYDTCVGA